MLDADPEAETEPKPKSGLTGSHSKFSNSCRNMGKNEGHQFEVPLGRNAKRAFRSPLLLVAIGHIRLL